MKKVISFILTFVLLSLCTETFSQTLEKATLVQSLAPVLSDSGKVLYKKIEYDINCVLSKTPTPKEDAVINVDNWRVFDGGELITLEKIVWTSFRATGVKLVGPFKGKDNLTVGFLGAQPIAVTIDSTISQQTKWGFGKGKAFDFNAQRLAQQSALFAFDYDFKVNILERNLMTPQGSFWFRSLSFNLNSEGTFASDDEARNGTQTSLEFAVNPFYFVHGLVYRGQLGFSFQIETQINEAEDKLLDVINRNLRFSTEIEVPLTNYPIFKLHSKTGYVRLAMPLTLSVDYMFSGEDSDDNDTSARLDFKARYELAFSPYLIVQGEWHRSKFFDIPSGTDATATYYSIAFAQDLDVVKKSLGFLKFILGPGEEIRGKNFIFFRISNGRTAPAFVDIDEKAIGFGTYF